MIELGAFTYDISLIFSVGINFLSGERSFCRCVRTKSQKPPVLVIGQESFFSVGDWILDLPARSLCGDHDVARGAFHPPASKARPAVGGEGLLRCPSVGISVRDLYWHHDI